MKKQPETPERFETWAVVEIFGHQTYVGKVTEQTIGGCSFVRVDVPELTKSEHYPCRPAFTKIFGQGAIYSITPMEEATARGLADGLRAVPITVYIPPIAEPKQLDDGEPW